MLQWKVDIYISFTLLCFSSYTFIESNNFGSLSRKFPKLISFFLFLLSLILLFSSFRGNKDDVADKEIDIFPVIKILIGILIYIVFLKWIGYLPLSFMLIFYITLILGYKNKVKAIIFSFISTIIVYFIFITLLQVPIPEGIFRFL